MPANLQGHAVTDDGGLLWSSVLDSLRSKLSARRLAEVECGARSLERTGSSLRVAVKGDALHAWVQDGRLSLLDASVTALSDGGAELALLPVDEVPDGRTPADPTRGLDRFIASPSNQPVLECARSLGAATPGKAVLLHGPPGAGKTHLLHGVAQALAGADHRYLLCSAERLSLDLVAALRTGRLDDFRDSLLDCGTLLIDDAHGLVGREATQQELCRVLELRAPSDPPVVVTSRTEPGDFPELRADLRAGLQGARSFALSSPEWETRVGVILDRIAQWRVDTLPEVASFLARSLGASLSRLDAVLTRLMTHPACANGLLDSELVQRVLENPGPLVGSAQPQDVIRLVSQHFSVRLAELHSKVRSPRVTTPRQLAMYLLRHHCGMSYPEIGQRFRRHHTTAMHACRKIEQQRDRDSSLRTAVLVLEKELLRISDRDTVSEGGE